MKLTPFTRKTICPKCGCDMSKVTYCTGWTWACPVRYEEPGRHHLDVKCQFCGYTWIMATKDHVEEQGQETP